jgi:hypothetical protein
MAKVPEEIELDSGVTVNIRPVPPRLYSTLVSNYEKRRPRPQPPMVEVKFKGEEPELQPNEDDPDYRAKATVWQRGMDAHLQEYFLENAVQVDVPETWRGENLRAAGVRVPRPYVFLNRFFSWVPILGGWLRRGRKRRARLYLDYVALQSFEDIRRLNEGLLSAAGLYTEGMVGDAEESFRGRGGRAGADQVGHEVERSARVIDLHRSQGGDGDGAQVPDGVGGAERAREGEGGSLLPHQDEAGDRDRRARGEEGQDEGSQEEKATAIELGVPE